MCVCLDVTCIVDASWMLPGAYSIVHRAAWRWCWRWQPCCTWRGRGLCVISSNEQWVLPCRNNKHRSRFLLQRPQSLQQTRRILPCHRHSRKLHPLRQRLGTGQGQDQRPQQQGQGATSSASSWPLLLASSHRCCLVWPTSLHVLPFAVLLALCECRVSAVCFWSPL